MTADRRPTVLVVGTGPAGLAAAARLLEVGGDRYRVRIAGLGHHVGGKADSWRDGAGRIIDHGQHVIIGWYFEMKALLRRAGVDPEARLVSNHGKTHIYEPRDGRVHTLALRRNPVHMLLSGLGYSGFTAGEKAAITRFVFANASVFLGLQDLEQFDDICFTSWALSNGLCPSVARTNAFRMHRTGQLSWPREISAYSMLRAVVEVGRDYRTSQFGFCDGGMTERFWDPIARYIARLGGEFEMMRKLTSLELDHDRVTGATFAEPSSGGHEEAGRDPGRSRYEHTVPIKPGTETVDRGFDHLICTLPATAFQELSPGDAALWGIPTFAKIRNLRGIAPLALQLWHREPLTHRYPSVLAGLGAPFDFVLDNKHIVREYRDNPRYGAVLYFVGQETGFEDWHDEQHLAWCLDAIARLPGFERIDRDGILHHQVIRNRSVDKQYFNVEPGIQTFRPHTRTPLANLWLAGDWVRNDVDFPCMEAAVRSGRAAADAVLDRPPPT